MEEVEFSQHVQILFERVSIFSSDKSQMRLHLVKRMYKKYCRKIVLKEIS